MNAHFNTRHALPPRGEAARSVPTPLTIAPQSFCATCEAMAEIGPDGCCLECLSIVVLVRWQNTDEAWRADARAMECAEPVDPFYAPDRALNRGYWSAR